MSATRIAINTVSQLIGKFASAATTLLMTLILAQALGSQGYGDITKITIFVAIFYLLADFGLNTAYIQLLSDETYGKIPLWNILFTLRTLYAIILAFIAISIVVFLPGSATDGYTQSVKFGILLFAPSIVIQSVITSANAVFQKNLSYQFATIAVTAGSVMTLLLVYLSTRIFLPHILVIAGVTAMCIGSAVTALVSLWFVQKIQPIHFSWDIFHMTLLWKTALPLGIMLLFDVIYFRADNIILTLFRPTGEVGTYGFAYKLFEFPLVFPTFFMNAVYPLMQKGNAHGTDTSHIRSLFQKSIMTTVGISVLALVVGWVGAPYITLVRQDFAASVGIFRILCLGLPVFFASGVTLWTLIALKKQGTLVWIYAVAMVLNIVSNYLLIPQYGSVAAAWVTVGSETFVLLLSLLLLRKEFRL